MSSWVVRLSVTCADVVAVVVNGISVSVVVPTGSVDRLLTILRGATMPLAGRKSQMYTQPS
jgi:hypothetical protein